MEAAGGMDPQRIGLSATVEPLAEEEPFVDEDEIDDTGDLAVQWIRNFQFAVRQIFQQIETLIK